MGQLDPEVKIVSTAVNDMIDIFDAHSNEDASLLSHTGWLLMKDRFERVPEEYMAEVEAIFEASLESRAREVYDA